MRTAALVLASLALASAAHAAPLFGPTSYERTTGAPDTYQDTITAATAGTYVVWVQNGHDGSDRVSSGTVAVNGATIFGPADFNRVTDVLRKAIVLSAGANTLDVSLAGDPGASITLVVLPAREWPDAVVGRLLLPHGDAADLTLNLKSGAHVAPRHVRVLFFDDAGALVASSAPMTLAPHASFAQPASSLVANGSWTSGSIEVLYAGGGGALLHGDAVTSTGVAELHRAGVRRFNGRPGTAQE